jgi:hypothetical protein
MAIAQDYCDVSGVGSNERPSQVSAAMAKFPAEVQSRFPGVLADERAHKKKRKKTTESLPIQKKRVDNTSEKPRAMLSFPGLTFSPRDRSQPRVKAKAKAAPAYRAWVAQQPPLGSPRRLFPPEQKGGQPPSEAPPQRREPCKCSRCIKCWKCQQGEECHCARCEKCRKCQRRGPHPYKGHRRLG